MAARKTASWLMATAETAAGGRAAGATQREGMPTGEMLAEMRKQTQIRIHHLQLLQIMMSQALDESAQHAATHQQSAEAVSAHAAASGNAPMEAFAVAPAPPAAAAAAAAEVDHVADIVSLTESLHINPDEQSKAAPRAGAPAGRKQVTHRKKTRSHATQHTLRKKGKYKGNTSLKQLLLDLASGDDIKFDIYETSLTFKYLDTAAGAVAGGRDGTGADAAAGTSAGTDAGRSAEAGSETSAGTVSGASMGTLGGIPALGGSGLAVNVPRGEAVVPLKGRGILGLPQPAKEYTPSEDTWRKELPFNGMSLGIVSALFEKKYMAYDAYNYYQAADGHFPLRRAFDYPLTMWAMIKYVPFHRAGDAQGRSVLHRLALADAAGERCWGLVQFVVCGGAKVNAFDATGATPLHYTAHGGSVEMAKELFAVGASLHVWAKAGPWRGLMPLHLATDSAMREFLLQYNKFPDQ